MTAPRTPEPTTAATAPHASAALLPVLALTFNALVWGLSWWPFKQLHAQGLHPLWATAGMYVLALAGLLAVRPQAPCLARGHTALLALALASGLTNIAFNWSVTVGDVVRVVLLFYLMPAWAVLFAWLLLGERPTATRLAQLVLALAGVGVVLGAGSTGLPLPTSGADWLALLGGASFALTNVLLSRLARVPAPARVLAMFGGGTVTALAAGALGIAQGVVPAPVAPHGAGLWLGLALAAAFLAGNVALQYGAARLAAHTTALVMLSEVVFASVSSVLLGAAAPGLATWLGGALIVVAAAWSAWPARPAAASQGPQSHP